MLIETLEQAGYVLESQWGDEAVVVDDEGKRELWVRKDDNPSYTLVIDGIHYEFVTSLPSPGV